MIITSDDAERKAVLTAAELMVVAARTAPKGLARDNITTAIVTGEDKERLADKLEEKKFGPSSKSYIKEARNVRDADAVVLVGVKVEDEGRRDIETINLGVAIGSAVKTASILNIDNRVCITVGRAAKELKIIEGETIYGIPLSVKGSNIFFDRYDPHKQQWQGGTPFRPSAKPR